MSVPPCQIFYLVVQTKGLSLPPRPTFLPTNRPASSQLCVSITQLVILTLHKYEKIVQLSNRCVGVPKKV